MSDVDPDALYVFGSNHYRDAGPDLLNRSDGFALLNATITDRRARNLGISSGSTPGDVQSLLSGDADLLTEWLDERGAGELARFCREIMSPEQFSNIRAALARAVELSAARDLPVQFVGRAGADAGDIIHVVEIPFGGGSAIVVIIELLIDWLQAKYLPPPIEARFDELNNDDVETFSIIPDD